MVPSLSCSEHLRPAGICDGRGSDLLHSFRPAIDHHCGRAVVGAFDNRYPLACPLSGCPLPKTRPLQRRLVVRLDSRCGTFFPWRPSRSGKRRNLSRGLANLHDVTGRRTSLPPVGSNGRCTWALALASHSPHKRTRTQLGRSHGKCDCLDLSQCFSDQSCALRNRLRGMRNHRLAQLVSTHPRDPAAGYAPCDDLRAHCPRTRGSLSFAHYRPPRQPHRH